jgi:ABC-type polysaccharide/polyol phosphate transport system ATPase subunit
VTSPLESSSRPTGAAIVVDDVSKRFRLYKDRSSSLKQLVTKRTRSRYDEFWALRDVSFTVEHGTSFGLVGHNGSGKSTMLRLLAKIHRPTSGTISTHGRISALLDLGAGFHPELSGRENVYLNGAILGFKRRDIDRIFDDIVDFSGLSEFIDSPVKVYSSGMYVRLGFSVAVHMDPEILMIDEVIAVGDEEFQRRCFDHMYKLRRDGVTIVLVSHSLALMQSICEEVVWFDHGRVLASGSPLEVIRQYVGRVDEAEGERISGTEAKRAPGSVGTGDIEVKGIELLGGDARPIAMATTAAPLVLRLHYDAHRPVDNPSFGIAIESESGVYLSALNTRLGGIETGTIVGSGHLDYTIPRMALMPGIYLLSVGVTDEHELHTFDYVHHYFELHISAGDVDERRGFVDIGGHWSAPIPSTATECER